MLEREKELLLSKLSLVNKAIEVYSKPTATIHFRYSTDTASKEPNLSNEEVENLLERYQDIHHCSTVREKVLLVLRRECRFMHVREIAKIFHCLGCDPSLQQNIRNISPALSLMKKNPAFGLVSLQINQSHHSTIWGFKEWLNQEGAIMPEYQYNKAEMPISERDENAGH